MKKMKGRGEAGHNNSSKGKLVAPKRLFLH